MALRRIYALRDDFAVPSAALLYVAYVLPSAINTAWLSVASSLGVLVVARAHGIEADALAGPSILLAAAFTVAGMLVLRVVHTHNWCFWCDVLCSTLHTVACTQHNCTMHLSHSTLYLVHNARASRHPPCRHLGGHVQEGYCLCPHPGVGPDGGVWAGGTRRGTTPSAVGVVCMSDCHVRGGGGECLAAAGPPAVFEGCAVGGATESNGGAEIATRNFVHLCVCFCVVVKSCIWSLAWRIMCGCFYLLCFNVTRGWCILTTCAGHAHTACMCFLYLCGVCHVCVQTPC